MIIAHCAAKREQAAGAEGGGRRKEAREPGKFVALGTSCSTRFKEIRDIFMGTCQIKSLPRDVPLPVPVSCPSGCPPHAHPVSVFVALCRSVDNKSGHIILKFPARGLQC